MEYLDVDELAALLGESAGSIRKKIRANSNDLPPRMRLPGNRMLRWRVREVENWMWETGWTRMQRS